MASVHRGLSLLFLLHGVWAKVYVNMQRNMDVFVGAPALLPCRYNFSEEPSSFVILWFVLAPEASERQNIVYQDSKYDIMQVNPDVEYSKRINVTTEHNLNLVTIRKVTSSDHLLTFFCQVNGWEVGSTEVKTTLRVYALPEKPIIKAYSHAISVTYKQPAQVAICTAQNAFPKPNITWYKNGELLEPIHDQVKVLGEERFSYEELYIVQSILMLRVDKETKDALFSCRVNFSAPEGVRSLESNPVNVTVHYPTSMVELWKEYPPGLLREGDNVELRCQGDGNPPPTFNFTREQQPDVPLESKGDTLILSSVTRNDSGLYQCRPGGPQNSSDVKGEVQLTVHYLDSAEVVPAETEIMLQGEDMTATCNALSSLKTSTMWYKDGHIVGTGSTLFLQNASFHTAGEYVCEVTVPALPALHTQGSVHIIVHGPPQVQAPEQDVHVQQPTGRMLNLSCEAQGFPAPSVSWSLSAGQSWEEVLSHFSLHSSVSVVSIRVSSDFSAVCNASNDLGSEARVFNVKAVPMATSPAPFAAESRGGIIVGIILGLLLVAVLGGVIYFLHKKNRLPFGRSGKHNIARAEGSTKNVVVEMKPEESILLKGINGDKAPTAQ